MKKLLSAFVAAFVCGYFSNVMAADRFNLRGQRYGEVMLGKGGLLAPKELDVYNTIGLNDCPQELWSKLDVEDLKATTGSKMVKLNGPRYWTIDGLTGSTLVDPALRTFGGIEMRHAGTLVLSLQDKLFAGKPYVTHEVARKTTWVFDAGKPVYQLVNPAGEVFFMQSYSVQKTNQSPESLQQLGARLHLPKGWKFRTLILKKPFQLSAVDGMAYVTQDDFENTYQKSQARVEDQL